MNLSWADFITRLAATPEVDGLLSIGSLGRDDLGPASDFDLVVVLRQSPVPLRVALAQVEGRLADIIFVDAVELAHLLGEAAPSHPAQWTEAQLLRWLRDGKVESDRSGWLRRAKALAEATADPGPSDSELYSAWFSINYNVRQTQRLLASDDPAQQTAVDLRLLFSLHDLWRMYFLIRRVGVYGEKAQVRYLSLHDPRYLTDFRACLAQLDRATKFQAYLHLAAQTLEPMGGLWLEGEAGILPDPDLPWSDDTASRARAFWQRLLQ